MKKLLARVPKRFRRKRVVLGLGAVILLALVGLLGLWFREDLFLFGERRLLPRYKPALSYTILSGREDGYFVGEAITTTLTITSDACTPVDRGILPPEGPIFVQNLLVRGQTGKVYVRIASERDEFHLFPATGRIFQRTYVLQYFGPSPARFYFKLPSGPFMLTDCQGRSRYLQHPVLDISISRITFPIKPGLISEFSNDPLGTPTGGFESLVRLALDLLRPVGIFGVLLGLWLGLWLLGVPALTPLKSKSEKKLTYFGERLGEWKALSTKIEGLSLEELRIKVAHSFLTDLRRKLGGDYQTHPGTLLSEKVVAERFPHSAVLDAWKMCRAIYWQNYDPTPEERKDLLDGILAVYEGWDKEGENE